MVTRLNSVDHCVMYLFVYLLLPALGLHCCSWTFSSCSEQELLPSCWLLVLWCTSFIALWHVASSQTTWSLALAGRFFTTGPPGKSCHIFRCEVTMVYT